MCVLTKLYMKRLVRQNTKINMDKFTSSSKHSGLVHQSLHNVKCVKLK